MRNCVPQLFAWLSSVRDNGKQRSFTQMLAALGVDSQDRRQHFRVYRQLTELDVRRFEQGLDLLSIWVGYKNHPDVVPPGHERLLQKLKLVPEDKTATEVRDELQERSRRRAA